MKTIWIMNQYASTLTSRHLGLGREFTRQGYRCIVITSSFHHGDHKYLFPESYHVEDRGGELYYIYLHAGPAYTGNGGKRVLSFFDFNRLAEKHSGEIVRTFGKPSFIIASSLSPMVWEQGYRFARRYEAKWVAEFRDIWPLQLMYIRNLPKWHPMVWFFGIIAKRAYRRSDAIVSTMPNAWKYVCDELGFPREKVHWMPNGIDTGMIDSILAEGNQQIPPVLGSFLRGHWCCVFCGSLAKSERVAYMVEAFAHVQKPEICFAIVGAGHCEQEVREAIRKNGLEDRVRLFPRVPYEQVPVILKSAGCCVAAIHDSPLFRYGLSMLKLTDYLYVGKPIVLAYSGESPVKKVGGAAVPSEDKDAFARAIEAAYAMSDEDLAACEAREKALVRETYDYAAIGQNYIRLLESL